MQTTRFQIIEIPVSNAGLGAQGRLLIGDQPQLRTQSDQVVVIQALQSFDAVAVPYAPSGAVNATVAQLSSAYLVLNIFGYENLQYIPMNLLNNLKSSDTAVQRFFSDRIFELNQQFRVDWSKSYIQTTVAIAAPANVSFLLGVHYYLIPDDTKQTAPLPYPFRVND